MTSAKERIVKSAASIVVIFSISCMKSQLPDVQLKPVSQYSLSQQKNDIALAIDPFFEEERVKEYFDFNFLSEGILPIFVVVENQSDNLILIHPEDLISAFGRSDSSTAVGGTAKIDSSINEGENRQRKLRRGFAVAELMAAVLSGSVIPIFASIIDEKDYTLIRYNLRKKMLLDRTLSRNEAASGFVFLKIDDKSSFSRIKYLQVRIRNLQSGEMETFVYPIESRAGR